MKYNDIMLKLQEVQTRQEELLNANAAEVQKYEDMLQQSKQIIDDSMEKSTDAYKSANIEEYHKYLDEKRSNEDAAEMYKNRIEGLKKNPLVSEDEYRTMIDEITNATDQYIEDRTREYTSLLEKLLKMRQELSSVVLMADELVSVAQKKILREKCGIYNSSGTFIPVKSKEKRYKNTELLDALYDVTRSSFNAGILSQAHSSEEVTGQTQLKRWGTA